jgi:hypothetical protein
MSVQALRFRSRVVQNRVVIVLAASALAIALGPAAARATEFTYTGSEQTWSVPIGATGVHVVAVGAPGGGPSGGEGAIVTADVPLPAGSQTLYVEVGGAGKQAAGPYDPATSGAGFNGGGAGGQSQYGFDDAFGGGGGSDVRTCSTAAGVSCTVDGGTLASRLVVAGGGGGGGGGGGAGQPGSGAYGGTVGALPWNAQPGSQTAGGAGANCYFDPNFGPDFTGGDGALGVGGYGDGGPNVGAYQDGGSGGGGGGGYYGGGGSISYDELTGCGPGGGAGGSSYVEGDASAPAFTLDPTLTPTVTVSAPVPVATGSPVIGGMPRLGGLLAAGSADWTNSPSSITYQWYRCGYFGLRCEAIAGATQKTYRATLADLWHSIRVTEGAVNSYGSAQPVSSGLVRIRLLRRRRPIWLHGGRRGLGQVR